MSAGDAPARLAFLKEVATVLFFLLFTGVCVWLLFVRRETTETQARIPLHDDEVVEPRREVNGG